jgi:hypothetical protein
MDVTLVAATYHITSPQKLFKGKESVWRTSQKETAFVARRNLLGRLVYRVLTT